ncbi:DUF3078 domain-containing protein [Myroides pelagicus]|uniref:DUF3078 domain-containing protein n=2 Tax=Myroides pelagicus TaxID=270914 RepID=A0A7K1GK78_9FLAO|nr:DUF3078 domain-containing protein [Myroides pelagicus]
MKSDTIKFQENPFNPLMGFLPMKDYGTNTMNYTRGSGNYDLPYFKPEFYVKATKPKFTEVEIKYNPNIDLNLVPLNDEVIGYWDKKNKLGLDLNQIAFVNWSSGGENSISGIIKGDFQRKYTKGRFVWDNTLSLRYGVNKQSDRELRKTDDVLDLNISLGYRKSNISDWYYVTKVNFKTQFTDGFNYPNIDDPISRWFAPAYLFVGMGGEYVMPKSRMKFYISPVTYKATFVLDQTLANQGAFGVQKAEYDDLGNMIRKGKNSRAELGFLLSNEWKKEVLKNIFLDHKLSLYSDYLNNFGNIYVSWEMKIDLKVNEYVHANIGTYFIYDDNVKSKVERDGVQVMEGPKPQFKQTLGVGLVYTF